MSVTYTPRPNSLYGRLIAAVDVEQALKARLDARFGDYLAEVERQHGLDRRHARAAARVRRRRTLPRGPATGDRRRRRPAPPTCPIADGQGRYAVAFELVLGVHVAASDGARELATLYALALRALAVQQPSPLFMGVDWVNEDATRGPNIARRPHATTPPRSRSKCRSPT